MWPQLFKYVLLTMKGQLNVDNFRFVGSVLIVSNFTLASSMREIIH